jgi:hypothetical protein
MFPHLSIDKIKVLKDRFDTHRQILTYGAERTVKDCETENFEPIFELY